MSFKINSDYPCYFCAGARNEKLLSVFPESNINFEVDERMASFKALGFSKFNNKPSAICVTSGTAVTETLSALIEAKYSKTKLVLISADRPKKMHGTGAPQTLIHEKLTSGFVGTFIEVDFNDFKDLEITDPVYPIHINVLVDDTIPHDKEIVLNQTMDDFKDFCKDIKNPLFLISHESKSMLELGQVLKDLNLNVYFESLTHAKHLTPNLFEKSIQAELDSFDSVIRIGHTPLSKVWRLLETNIKNVFSFDERNLSALSYGQVCPLDSNDLLASKDFLNIIKSFKDTNSLKTFNLETLLTKYPKSEPSLLKDFQNHIPEGSIVYLGNSLTVRYFEMVQTKYLRTYGARGVNGIDGQISQAIGMAQSTDETVYAVIGDMTAIYDLSALKEMPKNLKLIIINNGGGQIFKSLGFNPKLSMEHDFNFKALSSAFNLTYSNDSHETQIIELFSSNLETQNFFKSLGL